MAVYIVRLITLRLYMYIVRLVTLRLDTQDYALFCINVYLRLKNFPKVSRVIPYQMVENFLGLDRPVSKFDANLPSCCSI